MFQFASWAWLLALPLPSLIWWALKHRPPQRAQAALFHPQATLLARLASEQAPVTRRWPWLWIIGCALLIVALARPVWISLLPGEYPARDFMIAIDISGSMRAQDFIIDGQRVDRLAVVKKMVDGLLAARRGDRAGLIVFGDDALTLSPVSHDLPLVRELLKEIDHGIAGEKTALGDAVALAVKRLRERPPEARILLLFSDGANTAGALLPARAAELARQYKVRIYSIGIGREGRVPYPGGPKGDTILTELPMDEGTLKALADDTGGRYYRAERSETLQAVLAEIDRAERVTVKLDHVGTRHDWYGLPLALGLLLLALALSLRRHEVLPS